MRTEKWLVLCIALLLIQLVACERGKMEENAPVPVSARMGADSTEPDSIPWDTIRTDSIWKDTIKNDSIPKDTIVRDSTIADSSFSDTLGRRRQSAFRDHWSDSKLSIESNCGNLRNVVFNVSLK